MDDKPLARPLATRLTLRFSEIGGSDVPLVGGKNAALGEMYRELAPLGVPVPNGFAVTAHAYRTALERAGAWPKLREALEGLDPEDVTDLATRSARARDIVYAAPLPVELITEILDGYSELRAEYGAGITLAVRSSATAEDLPTASFAGQHETFLNVHGEAMLLDAVRRCFASVFNDRAVRYRIDQGFDHFKVLLSVGVQKMVRSDLAASGVAFSLDTETGFRDVVLTTAAYGLGENVVQGAVDPDEFLVFKPALARGKRAVLRRTLGGKKVKMVYGTAATRRATVNVPTSPEERARFCITDDEVLTLADYTVRIESHFSARAGHPVPVDVEWARDGEDGKLYVVQARPETVASRRSMALLTEYAIEGKPRALVTGRAVGQKVASGRARIVRGPAELAAFEPGDVLVADTTAPDWGTVMKRAAAIVTNRGGRTCHAAIVARELGIPAVVGAENATTALHDGDIVTVSCAEGTKGRVYAGAVRFTMRHTDTRSLPRTRTQLMVNIGDPDLAFQLSFLPVQGVGLARMEFVIANHIRAHPMALLHPERIDDAGVRAQVEALTRNHASGAEFFVERLSEGVATIAAAFHPRPVIVRMSDFKTNEYASLLGGRWFEPEEENPMIGFRGASRYAHPAYAEGFALECAAMKRVREAMGLDNVKLMIPFCRRLEEAEQVVTRMAELGLARGMNGLEIYVMCEIPNNVILADGFSRWFDGFSIGSNDLTQLVLGVDRDSELVAFDYEERDAGVMEMIRLAIAGAHRNHRHIGICGQAPSDYPEYAGFLVREGIDSISLNPDSVLGALQRVAQIESLAPAGAP
ncbi:MAG TPA: phosphoenolpyruvate synthase [Usitatibacter sp.]|nr:phosphoenolpyruvate synthase [Usitatibacter sp.]